jgi:hypothetical protein
MDNQTTTLPLIKNKKAQTSCPHLMLASSLVPHHIAPAAAAISPAQHDQKSGHPHEMATGKSLGDGAWTPPATCLMTAMSSGSSRARNRHQGWAAIAVADWTGNFFLCCERDEHRGKDKGKEDLRPLASLLQPIHPLVIVDNGGKLLKESSILCPLGPWGEAAHESGSGIAGVVLLNKTDCGVHYEQCDDAHEVLPARQLPPPLARAMAMIAAASMTQDSGFHMNLKNLLSCTHTHTQTNMKKNSAPSNRFLNRTRNFSDGCLG